MKAGIAPVLTSFGERSDYQMYQEEFGLLDMAEPMGFDSIWSLEHHFTGYNMTPNPTQVLSYMAGRTRRVELGTAVIVLPWHNPVRVAEDIALLDVLAGGRTIFGFGRGAASVEYDRIGVRMDEARERFAEAATIIKKALSQERFSHEGKFFKVPETSIRPRPISHPERRFYASTISPESAEMMAKMGFGVMIAAQRDWESAAADYHRYREVAAASGYAPRPPISLVNIIIADDGNEAEELGLKYMGRQFDSIDRHYAYSDGHLGNVKGYEFYGKFAKTYSKLGEEETKAKAVRYYTGLHLVGTPKKVLEKFHYVFEVTNLGHVIAQFMPGGMPHEYGERSLKLFAEQVMPVLQRDPAFQAKEEAAPPLAESVS